MPPVRSAPKASIGQCSTNGRIYSRPRSNPRIGEALETGRTFVPDGYIDPEGGSDGDGTPGDAIGRLASLTNQQSRILSLICEGKLNKQIAFDLSIAETTVKAHVTAIMRKLGVHSRTQAVLIAQEARFSKVLPGDE